MINYRRSYTDRSLTIILTTHTSKVTSSASCETSRSTTLVRHTKSNLLQKLYGRHDNRIVSICPCREAHNPNYLHTGNLQIFSASMSMLHLRTSESILLGVVFLSAQLFLFYTGGENVGLRLTVLSATEIEGVVHRMV